MASFAALIAPKKRGLKLRKDWATHRRRKSRIDRPEEEGTETGRRPRLARRSTCRIDRPEEEGTETKFRMVNEHLVFRAALIAPKKRGLKHEQQVCDDSDQPCRIDRPEEEGTETSGSMRPGLSTLPPH